MTKKNLPVPSARDINEAHRMARVSAETAVQHAIRCGQMLIERKASMEHGTFEKWVSDNCQFALSTARKYMKASSQNATGVAFSTLQSLFPSGTSEKSKSSEAPSAQSSAAAKPKSGGTQNSTGQPVFEGESSPAPGSAVSDRTGDASAPQASQGNQTGVTIESAGESHVASAQPDVSPVGSDPLDDEDWGPDEDEIMAREATEKEYQASIDKVMESDDRLSAAHAEIKRLTQLVAHLQLTLNGYQNQHGELVRRYQRLKREHERLQ